MLVIAHVHITINEQPSLPVSPLFFAERTDDQSRFFLVFWKHQAVTSCSESYIPAYFHYPVLPALFWYRVFLLPSFPPSYRRGTTQFAHPLYSQWFSIGNIGCCTEKIFSTSITSFFALLVILFKVWALLILTHPGRMQRPGPGLVYKTPWIDGDTRLIDWPCWCLSGKFPFALDGLALMIAFSNSWLFSAIFSGVKSLQWPIEAWMIPALSTLKAIFTTFTLFTAPATSLLTVPVLGFASVTWGQALTELTGSSVSLKEWRWSHPHYPNLLILVTYSSRLNIISAGCFCFSFLSGAKHQHFSFYRYHGSVTVPRIAWSAFLGSTPRRMCRSTEASNWCWFVSPAQKLLLKSIWFASILIPQLFFLLTKRHCNSF